MPRNVPESQFDPPKLVGQGLASCPAGSRGGLHKSAAERKVLPYGLILAESRRKP